MTQSRLRKRAICTTLHATACSKTIPALLLLRTLFLQVCTRGVFAFSGSFCTVLASPRFGPLEAYLSQGVVTMHILVFIGLRFLALLFVHHAQHVLHHVLRPFLVCRLSCRCVGDHFLDLAHSHLLGGQRFLHRLHLRCCFL